MPSIRVIPESGGSPVEQEVISRDAQVIPTDGEPFQPAVTQRVEYDHSGQTSATSTVCGETENRREGDKKPDVTVEGILTEPQLPTAKSLKEGEQITFISDVHQGQVFVRRLTITQEPDLLYYIENGVEELAFSFQLQLKQPE